MSRNASLLQARHSELCAWRFGLNATCDCNLRGETTMPDTETFRDATYTAETQQELKGLLAWLEQEYPPSPRHVALRDVIEQWDANEATEMTLTYADGV